MDGPRVIDRDQAESGSGSCADPFLKNAWLDAGQGAQAAIRSSMAGSMFLEEFGDPTKRKKLSFAFARDA
jgi:hypothetical protein